jgi:hypothetical protein
MYLVGGGGLWVFDRTDATAPVEIGSLLSIGAGARAVTIVGTTLLAVGESIWMNVVDIADPTTPTSVQWLELPDAWNSSIVPAGLVAYVSGRSGLMAFDVADPTHPALVGHFDAGDDERYSTDFALDGNIGYLMQAVGPSLVAVGLQDPRRPYEIATLDLGVRGYKGSIVGNLLAIAAGDDGVRVVDVTDVANLAEIAVLPTAGRAWSVALGDGTVSVGESLGARLVDVTDPVAPRRAGFVPTGEAVVSTALTDGVGLALTDASLIVFDATDPDRPVEISRLDVGGGAVDVATDGARAHVAIEHGRIVTVDLADPATPVVVATTSASGSTSFRSLAVRSTWAFAGCRDGLRIFDLSRAPGAREVAHFDRGSILDVRGVALDGPFAYLARGSQFGPGGFRIVDVGQPGDPSGLGAIDGWWATAVAGHSGFAYVTASGWGTVAIDIRQRREPRAIAARTTATVAGDIAVRGDLVAVADGTAGVQLLRACSSADLLPAPRTGVSGRVRPGSSAP